MSSERLQQARRLELTEPVEAGENIEGKYGGLKVTLIDRPERALQFKLDATVHWVWIKPRIEEINDPDVVTTGDEVFDRKIGVLAEGGYAPTVTEVLKYPELRVQLHEFFHRFPLAEFRGATLTVPHAEAETAAALKDASRLLHAMNGAISGAPRVALEAPPQLPPEVHFWRDPVRKKEAIIWGSFLVALVTIGVTFSHTPFWLVAPAAVVAGAIAYLLNRRLP